MVSYLVLYGVCHAKLTHESAFEGDGKSIYAKNLPLNIRLEELEIEFQKFGNLKPGGVHLRNQKVRLPCAPNQLYDILILLEPQNEL